MNECMKDDWVREGVRRLSPELLVGSALFTWLVKGSWIEIATQRGQGGVSLLGKPSTGTLCPGEFRFFWFLLPPQG
jgi:hypothetical protein